MGEQGDLISSLLPLVVLFAIFYFLIIRPQQKTQKDHKNMLGSLAKGDKIVSTGGLYFEIQKVEEEFLSVINDDGAKFKLAKNFISKKL
jgi:preprotein translocase subunit YajC